MAGRSLNKVQLIGNLGKDPELSYTGSGIAVAKFSIATSEQWKDDTGNKERTEWHNIVVWRKLAEVCGQYLKKGSKVYVEGKMQTRSWEKEGVKHWMTEVIVHDLIMLGGKPKETGADSEPADVQEEASADDGDGLPF